MRGTLHGWLGLGLCLGLSACSFDGGGVSDDDAVDASTFDDDSDGDGVRNSTDNCVDVDNADQRDEDGDDVGNACDNCRHVANADQEEIGEASLPDGIGDACDPQPSTPGNALLYFEGFDDADALDDWRVFNGGQWSISGGALHQSDPTGYRTLYLGTQSFEGIHVDTKFVLEVAPSSGPADSGRGFGTLIGFATGIGEGAGYYCLGYHNPTIATPNGSLNLLALRGAAPYVTAGAVALNANLTDAATYDVRHSLDVATGDLACDVRSTALPADVSVAGNNTTFTEGLVGLKTQFVGADIEYVAVFSLVP